MIRKTQNNNDDIVNLRTLSKFIKNTYFNELEYKTILSLLTSNYVLPTIYFISNNITYEYHQ